LEITQSPQAPELLKKITQKKLPEIPESPKLRVALARWSPDCNLSRAGRWIRGDGRSFEEEDGSWTEFAGEREKREERWIDIDRSIERERQLIVTVKQDKTQTMKQQDKTQRQDTETRHRDKIDQTAQHIRAAREGIREGGVKEGFKIWGVGWDMGSATRDKGRSGQRNQRKKRKKREKRRGKVKERQIYGCEEGLRWSPHGVCVCVRARV
jgi:hypothetical protein